MSIELRPVMAVSLFYITGIALGRLWLEAPPWAVLLSGLLLAAVLWALWKRGLALFAALLLLAAAAAGAAAFFAAFSLQPAGMELADYAGRPLYVEGTVVEEPLHYGDHSAYVLQVESIQLPEGCRSVSGRLLVKIYGEVRDCYRFGEKLRLRGTIVEPKGRRVPGGFDYAFYLRAQGIDGLIYPQPLQVSSLGAGETWPPAAAAVALRRRMVATIEAHLPSPASELLAGILFGQRRRLPEDIQENFTASGTGHLLAVSGLHVGLVAALILGLWRCLGLRGKLPLILALLLVLGYAYLTGMRPSALRAAVMLAFALGALLLERDRDLPTAVALAALAPLVLNPLYLFNIGFQLSYTATLAIIYLQPPLAEALLKLGLPGFVRPALAVTLASQLGVLPLCAYHFQHVPVGALFFNLLLVPLMAPVVGLGLGGALLGFAWPAAAAFVLRICGLLLQLVILVTGLARHPFFYRPVQPPSEPGLFLIYLLMAGAAFLYYRFRRQRQRAQELPEAPGAEPDLLPPRLFRQPLHARRLLLFAVLGVALLLVWGSIMAPPRPSGLVVTFLDVGQGAAALVEAPCGTNIIIDGGGTPPPREEDPGQRGEMVLLPFLRRQGVRRIDLVVASHPHEDHFGGLLPLVEEIPVNTLLISPVAGASPYYAQLLERAAERGISIERAGAGRAWGAASGLRMETLGPPPELLEGTGSDLNNNSLVLKVSYGAVSFLFCGDIENEGARQLLKQKSRLRAEVLLVPHHGGFMELLPELLDAVKPRYAVISVGPNTFGHPHPHTLAVLEKAGTEILRTDLHGSIILRTDGSRLRVETMLEPVSAR
ncbi:MAG: ComEC/Rec2 family competence protein [Firmicutes bacterium]|nr:ComEC/Rec2 family competence protein [Bacillota bacterium]HPU01135.1 ComEC/Rec2 family competence protein [Bacillota bacterium]